MDGRAGSGGSGCRVSVGLTRLRLVRGPRAHVVSALEEIFVCLKKIKNKHLLWSPHSLLPCILLRRRSSARTPYLLLYSTVAPGEFWAGGRAPSLFCGRHTTCRSRQWTKRRRRSHKAALSADPGRRSSGKAVFLCSSWPLWCTYMKNFEKRGLALPDPNSSACLNDTNREQRLTSVVL